MELRTFAIVGSVDREYQANAPTASWTRLMSLSERMGELSGGVAVCTLEPYLIGVALAGACCGVLGFGCWSL